MCAQAAVRGRAFFDALLSPKGMSLHDPSSELSAFDFSTIDDMDPSLSGGHRIIYEREVPFE